MSSCRAFSVTGLKGDFAAPGDKSISHRSLLLGGLAVGETTISSLLEGDDVLATAAAMRAMGASVDQTGPGAWTVQGVGVGGLREPAAPLDMGNSGTAVRLMMGLVASHPIRTIFVGDESLSGRPMERVMAPLRQMTAQFTAAEGGCLPVTVEGAVNPVPIHYELPVASAQVKSAVLLAGLNTPGTTSVLEPHATRDHTENMLRHFGVNVVTEDRPDGRYIAVTGPVELMPAPIVVPGDPSSAAFPLVAALITEGSDLTMTGVLVNPLRTGLFETLREMGADLTLTNERVEGGEPVADIRARSSRLRGVKVPADRVPSMIDEFPVLAMAAACAEGTTAMEGLAELRVKESDRLAAVATGLSANGVTVKEGEASLTVEGAAGPVPGGGVVQTFMDHRIAMAFLVLGCAAREPVTVDEDAMIATSFPNFAALMSDAGARFEAV
ncbi:MAG: 3-phosphoshikimate 1-carboxyvinyltransferase [Alphaproteobacteria bacterium]